MKHILFISDNFYPESNALANRLYDHARSWRTKGYKVTIITCAPNFPRGKIFNGYKNKWRYVEYISGIKVIRIKSYITENKGFFKRILDYISFALHASIQGLFVKNPCIVIGTSPQPFPVFSAWFIAKVKRKPFVFELRDLWPESIIAVDAMKHKSLLLRWFGYLIRCMYRSADVIISVTDSFKQILIEKENISSNKIVVHKNGVRFDSIKPTVSCDSLKKHYQLDQRKFLVGYVGTIGMAHSVETIIEAARAISAESKYQYNNIHFVIMGSGANADKVKSLCYNNSNITFIDGGSREDAINIISILDAAIVHLKDSELFCTVIPSKIFEIMALGKPILLGVKGEARNIVINQAKAGIFFEPENVKSLSKAVKEIVNLKLDKSRLTDFVQTHFDRDIIAIRLLKSIDHIIKQEK